MKKIFLLLLVVSPASMVYAQFEKAELQASGLTCSMCSNAINKALKTLPFVESIQTDLNKNLFTLTFKTDSPVDPGQIKKKVEDAGFSVAKFWVIMDIHNMQINNDQHVVLNGLTFHFMHIKPQLLDGPIRLQIIDKNYVLSKEYKKFSSYTSMPCYQTGLAKPCCQYLGHPIAEGSRIYHVTL